MGVIVSDRHALLQFLHEHRKIEQTIAHPRGDLADAISMAIASEHLHIPEHQASRHLVFEHRKPLDEIVLSPSSERLLLVRNLKQQVQVITHKTPGKNSQSAKLQLFEQDLVKGFLLSISEEYFLTSRAGDDVEKTGGTVRLTDEE